jgi:hypothetical protein
MEIIKNAEKNAEEARKHGSWAVAASWQSYANDLRRGMVVTMPDLPKFETDE